MNPSVFYFYFPLLMFILQLACSLRWEVEHKVSDYGQNLILLCRVSNCCLKDAGWYLWTPTKRTIFKDVKTARLSAPPKYSGYVRTYGFTLIINNLSQADMNVSYSCDYGLQLGDNIVLHKDDVFMNDRSGLSISVFVLIIAGGSVLTILLLAFVICICCRTLSYEHVETDDPFKGMLVGAAIGYGLGGFGPGMDWGWGWGWGPNPYSGYWGGWDEGGTVDIDYADYDFGDNMDYGYADSDVGEFEASDNGEGGDFGDFGGDDGGFYGGDGEGYTDDFGGGYADEYGGGYNDSFTAGDGGGYAGDYGGGDGGGFAGNEDGGYADNYAGNDGGGGDFGGDGGGCGGGCGGD